MVNKEDKILIKNLWESKGYGARRLIREFLYKNWKVETKRNRRSVVEKVTRNWFACMGSCSTHIAQAFLLMSDALE